MQDDTATTPPNLSIGKASKHLGVSIDTLRRWEKRGKIQSTRSPGGHRYFAKDDLNKLFDQRYKRNAAETTNKDNYALNATNTFTSDFDQTQTESTPFPKSDFTETVDSKNNSLISRSEITPQSNAIPETKSQETETPEPEVNVKPYVENSHNEAAHLPKDQHVNFPEDLHQTVQNTPPDVTANATQVSQQNPSLQELLVESKPQKNKSLVFIIAGVVIFVLLDVFLVWFYISS